MKKYIIRLDSLSIFRRKPEYQASTIRSRGLFNSPNNLILNKYTECPKKGTSFILEFLM